VPGRGGAGRAADDGGVMATDVGEIVGTQQFIIYEMSRELSRSCHVAR